MSKVNQFLLKLMHPNFVKHSDFGVCLWRSHGEWLSGGQNNYWKVAKFARCPRFIGASFPGVAARRSNQRFGLRFESVQGCCLRFREPRWNSSFWFGDAREEPYQANFGSHGCSPTEETLHRSGHSVGNSQSGARLIGP